MQPIVPITSAIKRKLGAPKNIPSVETAELGSSITFTSIAQRLESRDFLRKCSVSATAQKIIASMAKD